MSTAKVFCARKIGSERCENRIMTCEQIAELWEGFPKCLECKRPIVMTYGLADTMMRIHYKASGELIDVDTN